MRDAAESYSKDTARAIEEAKVRGMIERVVHAQAILADALARNAWEEHRVAFFAEKLSHATANSLIELDKIRASAKKTAEEVASAKLQVNEAKLVIRSSGAVEAVGEIGKEACNVAND
jgi:hypothetical protein